MKKKNSNQWSNTIIVQCHEIMTDEQRDEMHRDLVKQAETGIVVLPACCSLRFAPRDGIEFVKEA